MQTFVKHVTGGMSTPLEGAAVDETDQLLNDVSDLVDSIESSPFHYLNASYPLSGDFEWLSANNFTSFMPLTKSTSRETLHPNWAVAAPSNNDRGGWVATKSKKENHCLEEFTFCDKRVDVSLIPCRVCGDRTSGTHYGVLTCEGCKGFYRRIRIRAQNNIPICQKNNDCVVTKETRNRCQACRYRKCLRAGMHKNNIKFGRKSKQDQAALRRQVSKYSEFRGPRGFHTVGRPSPYSAKHSPPMLTCYPKEIKQLQINAAPATSQHSLCCYYEQTNSFHALCASSSFSKLENQVNLVKSEGGRKFVEWPQRGELMTCARLPDHSFQQSFIRNSIRGNGIVSPQLTSSSGNKRSSRQINSSLNSGFVDSMSENCLKESRFDRGFCPEQIHGRGRAGCIPPLYPLEFFHDRQEAAPCVTNLNL